MVLQNTGKFRVDKNDPNKKDAAGTSSGSREDSSESRIRAALENDRIDSKYGFDRVRDMKERTGFLLNMHMAEVLDEDKRLVAAMDYYFIEMDGSRFKVSLTFQPYFFILARKECEQEVMQYLSKKYVGTIHKMDVIEKEDLDLLNHLSGLKQCYIKLSFMSQNDMMKVRREILTAVNKNKEREKKDAIYAEMLTNALTSNAAIEHAKKTTDHMENILDIREHDVPYHVRVSIDLKIFCGTWYTVKSRGTETPIFTKRDDLLERPDPIVLAFDIETTKLPLKFPDSQTDQIMMISYMIDSQGYLITNREIISTDVEDFEYTPKPEFEGQFIIFNEQNELALIQKFFDHIMDVKPHIFVTYNGDFFDWPFVEARAAILGLDMKQEIGFSKMNARDGTYACRPAMHMDCLCWVKRDSYLPVGSQGLKAVAKAKLRYDPVELDPEDMCRMAAEQPQVLSNYSVSDAVATYYLYMKYVHPFIFALCTIIPLEPDEVLRKGSGTLCESLLMVEAFHANIVFPNKQVEELNKLTSDGHVLETETYVGGHVEALESGVFRADIKCKFRIVPSAVDKLIESTEKTMKHAIEVEEGVPLELVTNFDEVCEDIKSKLQHMRDHPRREENPLIYHLDVGAMYPNIILTNRLQPSAMVNASTCAVCEYNKPDACCQRHMDWMWRGDYLPATRSEYQRIQQQLETEKFPPLHPGGPTRAFHSLPKEEQAAYEKKRLADYCRVAYKKTKVTRTEVRTTTICQKENSFYVDTVRAFRDRRYEYKALNKQAKALVARAIAGGDAAEIKSAKSREVLFDSLQLAHKCILNSFYGYVMRRGARWHSMEMAGIVCYTGANIIMRAREIIEQVGRPLELDTDGIWCILPASFPENVTVLTTHDKKKKINVSYPNAVLNSMVKDYFTNDQYFELVDPTEKKYEQRSENSIFFEVDGPYLGMVLPASKEEGKKLKKRYAVFNFDGSLAELKGFEVKRRGELQLIKIFQSSVFEAFLKGNDLKSCYSAVARVADYWLDVLYSKGSNMPDSELFELISENRSMSKKLEDYGGQKSTSISTAKRLAEFLGDQMVKDAGLACKFIISRKPDGAPVTERAIPLAIFQSPAAVKRHHLRRWLKDNTISEDIDIRDVLDWAYYIERLSGAIQKIITIPAALQGLENPVPRVQYPDWLHKKMMAKSDKFKTRKITDMFSAKPKEVKEVDSDDEGDVAEDAAVMDTDKNLLMDMEDIGKEGSSKDIRPVVHKVKRKREQSPAKEFATWREALGAPPPFGTTKEEHLAWIVFQKKKWMWQMEQRGLRNRSKKGRLDKDAALPKNVGSTNTLGGFIKRAQRTLLNTPWQIIQMSETAEAGLFRVWALVGSELHQIKLSVPRIFYVNRRVPLATDSGEYWRRVSRVLPRARPAMHLYQYTVPERLYRERSQELMSELSAPEIEGIYETQMSLEFRVLVKLGCVCAVDPQEARKLIQFGSNNMDTFTINQLLFKGVAHEPYLQRKDGVSPVKHIFLYQHSTPNSSRSMWAMIMGPIKRAYIFVQDSVKTNQVPNMNTLYSAERIAKINLGTDETILPSAELHWEVSVETDSRAVYRGIQRALQRYRDEKCGPTMLALQSTLSSAALLALMPVLSEFPLVPLHVRDVESLYSTLEWQRIGARAIVRHYLNLDSVLTLTIKQCRYLGIPVGNMPADPTLFGADLFYARHLLKHNFVLWCSSLERPDLGGREIDDNRLVSETDDSSRCVHNASGAYGGVCVSLETDALCVCALLQAHHILQVEGTSVATSFGAQHANIQDVMANTGSNATLNYDETAQCSAAFKVLRTMIAAWLRDVTVYKNVFADFQISHFYRWLKTPTSLLYDPALRRTLYSLMKRLFLMLVAEFRRLGSQIVYADFNKIILHTNKSNVMDGIGYVEFVVQSIRNKELFHGIDIRYKECWSHLLWLDQANFAGIQGKLPEGLVEVGSSQVAQSTEESSEDEGAISMQWNLATYLGRGVQQHFYTAAAGFLSAAHAEPDRLRELLAGEISQKLFQITEKIKNRMPTLRLTDIGPQPGFKAEVLEGTTPALLFVNAVCKVFSLDESLAEQVTLLRRNLLRLIGVGEFSPLAEWRDACASCVLCEVICKACNHCRDLDLCLTTDTALQNNVPVCLCPTCGTAYENQELEWRLIEILNRRAMSYTLQDLICTRCNQVKRENLSIVCDCAGEFKLMLPIKEIKSQLATFKTIAEYYRMPLLSENIEFNLSNM
ncbi:DNA polymerase epsilon catalytic subunit 1 isoform X2 [Leptidea sinapis]|uniref:DNA polymerase epsilon catalytic subunit 1 isoform X2 n=1 Tax=Leptidea sinapis TaxID=189913 RepID=UPI00212C49A9|nr:DNA polymerase epsilon catalytic subunit 1 isoform X2 [Leptidea sinapis]